MTQLHFNSNPIVEIPSQQGKADTMRSAQRGEICLQVEGIGMDMAMEFQLQCGCQGRFRCGYCKRKQLCAGLYGLTCLCSVLLKVGGEVEQIRRNLVKVLVLVVLSCCQFCLLMRISCCFVFRFISDSGLHCDLTM